jgi:cytochrome c oxidase subunit 1
MSATDTTILNLPDQSTARVPKKNFITAEDGLLSWLLTGDHKRIAMLYLISITFFFFIGGAFAGLIRLELLTPQPDLVASDTYNKFFTMHGVIMVFLFLVPSVPATLGNFLIPIMLGARDLAFPKINLLSWYLYVIGGVAGARHHGAGRRRHRLDLYHAALHALSEHACHHHGAGDLCRRLQLHLYRAELYRDHPPHALPGHDLVPHAAVCVVALRGLHPDGAGHAGAGDRDCAGGAGAVFGIGVFDPTKGGDPLLFQHLFWFYSHPAVYIMILPGMGVISEVVSTFSRKRVFGYTAVAFSSVAIALFGFFVWEHHMFIMGVSNYSALVFSLLTMLVAVPSAIKIFNWSFTLQKGSITFETPMLYAFGFMGLFTIGGLTGRFLGSLGMDIHLTETYFIVAHFHFVMVGGMLMAFLSGVHFWWPKMTGRMYPEAISKLAAVVTFIGFNLTFLPQFILGYLGMPRRYHSYPPEFQVLNVLSTAGATVLGVGYMLPIIVSGVVAEVRRGCGQQSVAGDGPGVADPVAAADRELYRDPDHGPRSLRLRVAGAQDETRGDDRWITPSQPRDAGEPEHEEHEHVFVPQHRHHFETEEQQREAGSFGMWLFLLTEIMFFGGMFFAYLLYRNWYYDAFVGASNQLKHAAGRGQYGHPHHLRLLHGAGGVGGGGAQAEAAGLDAGPDHAVRAGLPRRQVFRVQGEVRAAPYSRRAASTVGVRQSAAYDARREREAAAAGHGAEDADLLLPLLCHDGDARAAHDHRHRAAVLADRARAPRRVQCRVRRAD